MHPRPQGGDTIMATAALGSSVNASAAPLYYPAGHLASNASPALTALHWGDGSPPGVNLSWESAEAAAVAGGENGVEVVLVPVLWVLLMVLGIGGNGLVVYVMMRYAEKNTTNCYIINLAFTDLAFVIIVVPFTMVHYVTPYWAFGKIMCKIHMYMIYVTLQATCLTLTAITVDRYFAIVHPISSMRKRTPRAAIAVSVCIWIVSMVICCPFSMYHDLRYYDDGSVYCREQWPNPYSGQIAIVYVVTICYLLPLCVISLCYARIVRHLWNQTVTAKAGTATKNGSAGTSVKSTAAAPRGSSRKRRRASKMIAVVVSLYAALWLPIHIFQLWFKFDPHFPKTDAMFYYKIAAHTLSYANSCVNPFVYAFLGDGFRKGVRKAFPWLARFFADANATASAPPQSSFNTRDAAAAAGNGHHGNQAIRLSGLRKYLPLRFSTSGTKSAGMNEQSGYIGVPTQGDEVSTQTQTPKLIPRPECAVIPEPDSKEATTVTSTVPGYLESDI